MKTLLVSLLFSIAGFSSIDVTNGFPSGIYSGDGSWEDDSGRDGSYTTNTEFWGSDVRLSYWWEGAELTLQLSFLFTGEGEFGVWRNGQWVGQGSCWANQCHYTADIDYVRIEETLEFSDTGLNKYGSKAIGDHTIYWQETLYLHSAEEDVPAWPADPVWPPVEQTDPTWPPTGQYDQDETQQQR